MNSTKTRYLSNPEHAEQAEFVSWWRKTQADDLFAIPNGGGRSKSQGARLRLEGVMSGVADMYAPDRHLWIEMKRSDRGSLSTDQRQFLRRRLAAGDRVIVGWGCDDAIEQVLNGERTRWGRPRSA